MKKVVHALTMVAMAMGGLHPASGWAQNPNAIGNGFTKAVYTSCLLPGDLAGMASIAVFPDELNEHTFAVPGDFMISGNLKCASQLHKNRCTKEMIAALGEVYSTVAQTAMGAGNMPSLPASASMRDPVTIGTVAGVGIGGVAGVVRGARRGHPILGGLAGAAVGGYVGNKAGKFVGDVSGTWAPAGSCAYRQIQLKAIAAKLQTPQSALIAPLGINASGAQTVLDDNVAASHVTLQEAEELRKEIALLMGRLNQIMVVINQ